MSDPTSAPPLRRIPVGPGFDPADQPWVTADDGLTPVPAWALTPQALRRMLASAAPWAMDLPVDNDRRYPGREGKPLKAAVLVPMMMYPDGIRVVLTQRTSHLREHAGQISFPGGRIEDDDASPVAAALREAFEETGLAADRVEVLGSMHDYVTATGFSITPVVGLVTPGAPLQAEPFEVEEIFEVPLSFLMNPANHRLHHVELPDGATRNYYGMMWQKFFIWGATAGMLRNLYHLLSMAAVDDSAASD
ncbi:CoA pyrophosphatase [Alcaligenaceae bacterium C4P045]|nr:CoA pyrophosphatase [Alcaligenaceae bacterium C4P045]